MSAPVDIVDAIFCRSPDRYQLPDEGLSDQELAASPVHLAIALNFPDQISFRVLQDRPGLLVFKRATAVAARWNPHSQGLMRALLIVSFSPDIEGFLCSDEVDKALTLQNFGLQAAMESLNLALRLWMVGPGVADPDALSHQPDFQGGVDPGLVTPWRTVIHGHALRQTVSAKHSNKLFFHGLALLIGASGDAQREAGMVIQYRQRVAAAMTHTDVSLEVHLPQIIGRLMLEPDKRFDLSSLWINARMTL